MAKASNKTLPVYKQFQQEVRRMIMDGQLAPGQQLPSERELQDTYNISRLTINKSLNLLADEGLLARYQGKGTFVAESNSNVENHNLPKPSLNHATVKYLAPGRNGSPASPIRLGVLEGMHQQLDCFGCASAVDFFNTPEQYEMALRRLPETSTAAIIWNEPCINPDIFHYLQKRKYPFVLLDSYPEDMELDYVIGDNTAGSRMMVEYLESLGHTDIVYITTPISRTSMRDRQAGFIQAAIQAGIEVKNNTIVTIKGDNQDKWLENIPAAINAILEREDKPTAIFLSNDILALKAIQYLDERGISVPSDITVVGYDNIDLAEYASVPLTTVAQHWMEIGRSAADIIYQKMIGPKFRRPRQVMVKPTLIQRKSSNSFGKWA